MIISSSQVHMSGRQKNKMETKLNQVRITYGGDGSVSKSLTCRSGEYSQELSLSRNDNRSDLSAGNADRTAVSLMNEMKYTETAYQEVKAAGVRTGRPLSGQPYIFVLFNSLYKKAGGKFKKTFMSIDELNSNQNMRLTDLQKLRRRIQTAVPPDSENVPVLLGLGDSYVETYDEVSYSRESSISFESRGVVKTADGREISFDMTMNMYTSSSYTSSSYSASYVPSNFKDPLIINFNGELPELTDEKISFDIDCDGTAEEISFLGEGSGFLALDKNHDGIVNNGSELFGPQSGNGFADLEQYDSDGNGWIDENDPVFQDLRIWTKDSRGNDKLLAISQAGIGAIYLGNISTDMAIQSVDGMINGMLRSTGVYLNEDGTAGAVQHMDLAV